MIQRRRHQRSDDQDLSALIAKGDESAFRELMERHQNAVYNLAFRLLGDAQEAEDAAQETFLRFYRSAARYQPSASLRMYLLKIARNLSIDQLRKKRPEPMDTLPEMVETRTPLDRLEGAIEIARLEEAIAQLPPHQREAIVLRHQEQLNYAHLADVMAVSVSAVESLLVRARRSLRQKLQR